MEESVPVPPLIVAEGIFADEMWPVWCLRTA
jgi:hypothetical protein